MTHDTTDEPKASHPWAVLDGDAPLFHTPGSYPPLYKIDPHLESLWRKGQREVGTWQQLRFWEDAA